MRTNIDIDDALMKQARKVSGLPTKKAAVEEGLRLLIRLKQQEDILRLAGKVTWQGNLDASREGRHARCITAEQSPRPGTADCVSVPLAWTKPKGSKA